MSKFNVGDKVRRIKGFEGDTLVIGNVYVVTYCDNNNLQVEGDTDKYAPEYFEIVQTAIQVGDTVRRTEWVPVSLQTDYPVMQVGATFIVKDVYEDLGLLYFDETGTVGWSSLGFQKVEEPVVERLAANVAAELLIEGTEPLQYYWRGEWYDVEHPHSVTVGRISKVPFRRKPKTIEINGVTVLAPLNLDTLNERQIVWVVSLAGDYVYETVYTKDSIVKNCWATKEDAQAVLDATLLPFKDL